MCWGIGSFLAAGILRGTLNLPGNAAWKVPYALQWIWPVPLFIIAWMAPESESKAITHCTVLAEIDSCKVHSTWSVRIESMKLGTSSGSSLDPDTGLNE